MSSHEQQSVIFLKICQFSTILNTELINFRIVRASEIWSLDRTFSDETIQKGGHITPQRLLKNYCLFSWVFVSLITSLTKLWRFCIEIINPRRESKPVEVIASNYIFFYFDFFCVLLECFLPFSTIFLWEMGQKPLRKIRLLVFLELYNQPDNSIFF